MATVFHPRSGNPREVSDKSLADWLAMGWVRELGEQPQPTTTDPLPPKARQSVDLVTDGGALSAVPVAQSTKGTS